jgi:hypothetical protein
MKKWIAALILAAWALLCCTTGGSAQDRKAGNANPAQELWSVLRGSLSSPNGEDFFRENMKDCALPMLVGTLISATPEEQPSVLMIAISDRSTPEITLRLKDEKGRDAHLNGPIMRGSEIRFEGVAVAFTKTPFMLTFEASTSLRKVPKRRNNASPDGH